MDIPFQGVNTIHDSKNNTIRPRRHHTFYEIRLGFAIRFRHIHSFKAFARKLFAPHSVIMNLIPQSQCIRFPFFFKDPLQKVFISYQLLSTAPLCLLLLVLIIALFAT